MVKEVHEIWVNEDASFDCESHSVKGEKCIEELRKLLEGLAEIDDTFRLSTDQTKRRSACHFDIRAT